MGAKYILYVMLILFLAGAYVWLGRYSYQYLTKYFNWPKGVVVFLSLGGLITGFIVILDEFHHTSMMGQNTRGWKNDPEHGVYIVPWKEVKNLEVVDPSEDAEVNEHE